MKYIEALRVTVTTMVCPSGVLSRVLKDLKISLRFGALA
jgi:hypothetical protein